MAVGLKSVGKSVTGSCCWFASWQKVFNVVRAILYGDAGMMSIIWKDLKAPQNHTQPQQHKGNSQCDKFITADDGQFGHELADQCGSPQYGGYGKYNLCWCFGSHFTLLCNWWYINCRFVRRIFLLTFRHFSVGLFFQLLAAIILDMLIWRW